MFPIHFYEWGGNGDTEIQLENHWHEEWEIFAMTSGSAVFTVDGQKMLLKEGDMCFIPSGAMHTAETNENCPCRYKAVVFNASFLYGFSADIIQTKYILPLIENKTVVNRFIVADEVGSEPYSVFIKLHNVLMQQRKVYEMKAKAYLFELLSEIIALQDNNNMETFIPEIVCNTKSIKRTISFINEHYVENITVSELSSMANMSPGYYTKIFKKLTASSPIDYVLKVRLAKAARLLEETDEKVFSISVMTGFRSMSYFTRVFQKQFGTTPTSYRKHKSYN